MARSSCAQAGIRVLSALNVLLLLLGFVVIDYALYLIHAHSYVISYACGTLLLSGSTLLVFTTAFACGGKRVPSFLAAYSTVLFLLLLSQTALLKIYAKKESREWLLKNAATHKIVDIVEHRQHLLRTLFTGLIFIEVLSTALSLCLSCASRIGLKKKNPYEYDLDDDFDIEEQESLLRNERRRKDRARAKARRKATADRIAKLRGDLDSRPNDSAIN